MSALDRGEAIGYVVGTFALPLLIAWLLVRWYERRKKVAVAHRWVKVVLIAAVVLVLSLAGRAGKQVTNKVAQTSPSAPVITNIPESVKLPDGWQKYEFATEGFGVDFPTPPKRVQAKTKKDDTVVVYVSNVSDKSGYTASWNGLFSEKEGEMDKMLTGVVAGIIERAGGPVNKDIVDTFQGRRARSYEIVFASSTIRGVVFAARTARAKGIYSLQIIEPAGEQELLYDRFVNSFKVLSQ